MKNREVVEVTNSFKPRIQTKKNVKQKNAQQENSRRSILSNFFLNYLAVAKIFKIPTCNCPCITLIDINAMRSDLHERVSIIRIQVYQKRF